jgi:hypothetical protein
MKTASFHTFVSSVTYTIAYRMSLSLHLQTKHWDMWHSSSWDVSMIPEHWLATSGYGCCVHQFSVASELRLRLIRFFFNSNGGGWSPNWVHSARRPLTCPGWLWWWRIWWNEDWQGKPKYSKKTCPSVTLFTTNPTWPDPGLNPGRYGGKPATNPWFVLVHLLSQFVFLSGCFKKIS